jgi:hypothetical protein
MERRTFPVGTWFSPVGVCVVGSAGGNRTGAPRPSVHAEAKYGETDYPCRFLFIHIDQFTSNVWIDC